MFKAFFKSLVNKISGRKRMPRVCRTLQIFALILFSLSIFLSSLSYGTSEKGLDGLTRKLINSSEIKEEYFDNYKNYGFTDKMCRELLEGEELKKLTAAVLRERISAIFRNTNQYDISLDDTQIKIRTIITSFNDEYNLGLGDSAIGALSKYTADISGISTMFMYNTPTEYRTSLYEANKEELAEDASIFKTIALFSSPTLALVMFLMYVIVVVLLYFIGKDLSLSKDIANSALYPSLAFLGFSIGEVFMPGSSPVTDYIFRLIGVFSLIGVFIGAVVLILFIVLERRD